MQALVISPHPDDAELGMGAAIAQMTDLGWEVILVDLTDGEPTPFGSKERRKAEADRASKILGLQDRLCLDMPNRHLEASLENRQRLAEVIRRYRPDMIFGPLPDDHPDHIATAELVVAARFEAKLHKTNLPGEPHWVATSLQYYSMHTRQHQSPSFILDVTKFWRQKVASIESYESQLANSAPPNTLSLLKRVEIAGRYFGMCGGVQYGEPFIAASPVTLCSLSCLTAEYYHSRA